jgi:anthranilate 1,2-dioxygenase large subunit/terephthalate 1,2-dioxygenase oxygenase component alpha subunit
LGLEIIKRIRRVLRAPVKVLGSYSQIVPSNWKLYLENVKDTYHASLLHTFFTTFRLARMTQTGGLIINDSGGGHASLTMVADTGGREYEQAGMRAAKDGLKLEAPELLESVDEFGDGCGLQILAVFPSFVLQQIRNSLAVRRIVPKGLESTELIWTAFGFEDDSPELTEMRLRQANLIGPAGYVSMEDGAAPGFVQRATRAAPELLSVVEMGGSGIVSGQSKVSEAAVRGMWHAWRQQMGL